MGREERWEGKGGKRCGKEEEGPEGEGEKNMLRRECKK